MLDDHHQSIIIKFDGAIVYSALDTTTLDHNVEVGVSRSYGEHIVECYASTSTGTTNTMQVQYLNWTYHYQPFTLEIDYETELGAYNCLFETSACGDCIVGRGQRPFRKIAHASHVRQEHTGSIR